MLPSRRLLRLLLAWSLVGLGAAFLPRIGGRIWLGLGLVLALALLVDGVWLWLRSRDLSGERKVARTVALGRWTPVVLSLHHPGPGALRAEVWDHHPGDAETRGLPRRVAVPTAGRVEVIYEFRAPTRGVRDFGPLQLRLSTPLGLWERDRKLPLGEEIRVFPDFAAIARYGLLATDHRLAQMGILRRQRRGEGMEFHQLREYRVGDSTRRIDWKATARHRRLITREYQDERDQQMVFLLDCGRRMRPLGTGEDGRSVGHFDQALNALFLLAYVALRQGDAVGVATFAEDQPRVLAPRKGLDTLDRLFQALFDLQPTSHASDLLGAAQALHQRLRRRALVVVLTNLRDDEDEGLEQALRLLKGRHLVLLANLREASLDDLLAAPVLSSEGALRHAAAVDLLLARQDTLRRLAAAGVGLLDVPPAKLPASLVNRYLEMKAGGVM